MTTLPPDPYQILGVARDATLSEIRSAHRKLILKCHPDKVENPDEKQEKQEEFQKVQSAYERLSDPTERAKYDGLVNIQGLRAAQTAAAAAASSTSANTSATRTPPTSFHRNPSSFTTSTSSSKMYSQGPKSYEHIPEEPTRPTRRATSFTEPSSSSSKKHVDTDDARRRRADLTDDDEEERAQERERTRDPLDKEPRERERERDRERDQDRDYENRERDMERERRQYEKSRRGSNKDKDDSLRAEEKKMRKEEKERKRDEDRKANSSSRAYNHADEDDAVAASSIKKKSSSSSSSAKKEKDRKKDRGGEKDRTRGRGDRERERERDRDREREREHRDATDLDPETDRDRRRDLSESPAPGAAAAPISESLEDEDKMNIAMQYMAAAKAKLPRANTFSGVQYPPAPMPPVEEEEGRRSSIRVRRGSTESRTKEKLSSSKRSGSGLGGSFPEEEEAYIINASPSPRRDLPRTSSNMERDHMTRGSVEIPVPTTRRSESYHYDERETRGSGRNRSKNHAQVVSSGEESDGEYLARSNNRRSSQGLSPEPGTSHGGGHSYDMPHGMYSVRDGRNSRHEDIYRMSPERTYKSMPQAYSYVQAPNSSSRFVPQNKIRTAPQYTDKDIHFVAYRDAPSYGVQA